MGQSPRKESDLSLNRNANLDKMDSAQPIRIHMCPYNDMRL